MSSLDSDEGFEMPLYPGTYEGERNKNEERHGFGKALLPNGDVYEGEYQNGQRHGSGVYTFVSIKASISLTLHDLNVLSNWQLFKRYEGKYIKHERHGQGTFWYPDGSMYQGDWAEGKRHGYRVYTYANGDKYEGNWKEGRRHGQGEYIYKHLGLKYKGNWNDGRFEDDGQLVTPNYSYFGTFNGEQPVGPGRFLFDTGCEQEGEYVTKRTVRRTNAMREVVHVPVWRCLALYDAGRRV